MFRMLCFVAFMSHSQIASLNAQVASTTQNSIAEQALFDLGVARDAVKSKMAYSIANEKVDLIHDSLIAQAKAARTRTEHLRVLEAFVFALGDHHSHLGTNDHLSPRLVPSNASVWVEMRDADLVVTQVRLGSAARRGGLREGMIVDSIDGVMPSELKTPSTGSIESMRGFAARVALAGTGSHDAVIIAHDTHGVAVTVKLAIDNSNRPDEPISLSWPKPNVALIRINNQLGEDALPQAFDVAMKDATKATTIILDLRDTPSGGDSVIAKPLMSWFVDGSKEYQIHQRGAKRWAEKVQGRQDPFKGKLIVLADHWTGSMGEGTVIGLRAAANAIYVGTPMAGLRGAIEGTNLKYMKAQIRFPVEELYEMTGGPRELAKPDVLVSEAELASDQSTDAILTKAMVLAN